MTPLASWRNIPLRTKGTVFAVILAAPLMVVYAAGLFIEGRTTQAERGVNHALETVREIQRLEASEIEASAQIRAYFLTREETFAEGVRRAIAQFDASELRLRKLAEDHPSQLQALSEAAEIQRSRVERIYSVMSRFRAGDIGLSQLPPILADAEKERLRIEAVLAGMRQREELQVKVCLERGKLMRSTIQGLAALCVIAGLAGAGVLWGMFQSALAAPLLRIRDRIVELAGRGAIENPKAEADEIGVIADGLARAAEALEQKAGMLENAPDGMAHCDAGGRYLSFNPAYAELAGFDKYNPPASLMANIHGEEWDRVESVLARESAEIKTHWVRPDGSMTEVLLTLVAAPGDPGGHYIYLHDLRTQRQAEAALTRAKEAAIASGEAKTRFLAKISHDIRTPLNAILGAADMLSETDLNPDQVEYVSMFQRNCRRLVSLINDFLDFSRIEAGAVRIEKTSFRVRQAVHDAVETFREVAWRKGVLLDVEIAPQMPEWQYGDPLRVQQVLINLLSNALKFTSAGRVSVRVQTTAEAALPALRFEVSDTGPGIRVADRESIFAPFAQSANQSAASMPGTGLGLTICRELVSLMGGEIGLTSEEDQGSTFYFTVPLEDGDAPEPVAEELSHTPRRLAREARILIVEDTEDNRILLRHYLRNQPVIIRFAENGREAVEVIRNGEEFDLILMDLDLPDMDGCTVTRLIREHQAARGNPSTPIVALSAHAIHETVRASLDAGCVAHVSKPVDRVNLLGTIARYARPAATPRPCRTISMTDAIAALAPKYLASSSRKIAEAQACLSSGSYEPIRRFGHNLKGTGRGYGFPEMEQMGDALERAANAGDEGNIAAQLTALHRFVSHAEADAIEGAI